MTKRVLSVLWGRLKQTLLAVDEEAPPYPLTLDEWAHVQRQAEARAQLAQMEHWQLEEALAESQASRC